MALDLKLSHALLLAGNYKAAQKIQATPVLGMLRVSAFIKAGNWRKTVTDLLLAATVSAIFRSKLDWST